MANYAQPQVLVNTEWVGSHRDDDGVVLVEVDVDTEAYAQGHVPGAVGWSWKSDLCDPVERDIVSKEALEKLMGEAGMRHDSTVVLYGDNHNWFAAWAFWQLKIFGHGDVRLMDGGRQKWEDEGRPMTTETHRRARTTYRAADPEWSLRAYLPEVREQVAGSAVELVDVRSPAEFTGEILAPPGLPETCQRGGHIPGASNIPWSQAVNSNGTFKPADELRGLYREAGITFEKPIVTYCRIGERSSHSWFVLKYLLGHESVRNYDGSWTEWGNLVGAPIAR